MILQDNEDSDYIEHDLLTLTCTSFQISLELAIKSLIIEKQGIRKILNRKQEELSNEEIEKLFIENEIKTLDFNAQKNLIKSKKIIYDLSKEDFRIMDEFQLYRNRIVHFLYTFKENELENFRDKIIYYIIHIILKILLYGKDSEEKPSEFIEYILGHELYKKLIKYTPYIEAMHSLVKEISFYSGNEILRCVVCNNRTLIQYGKYCYCCNFDYEDFRLINCDYCEEERTVLYDNLNIKLNQNIARGLCLFCENDGVIFRCPQCEFEHNIETNVNNVCTEEYCITFNIKNI